MKKIKFKAISKKWHNIIPKPLPSKKSNKPDWWKKLPIHYPENTLKVTTNRTNYTMKKCIPMQDAMEVGYMVQTFADVFLEQTDESFNITWRTEVDVFENHTIATTLMDAPFGYHDLVVKYNFAMTVHTPKGYSLLVVPPLLHNNLPFVAVPALIDTDNYSVNYALPVWVSKSHSGIISKDTPLAQLIPIKRTDFVSTYSHHDLEKYILEQEINHNKLIKNNYALNYHKKKKYE